MIPLLHRYKNRLIFKPMPMKYFTPNELNPSEKTLNIIRQIAHTYRAIRMENITKTYCLN